MDVSKVGKATGNYGFQRLSQCIQEGNWPVRLRLCIIILPLLPEDYRNSLLEVRRAVSLLKARVEEFVEVWE